MKNKNNEIINTVDAAIEALLCTYRSLENEPNLVDKYKINRQPQSRDEEDVSYIDEIKQHPKGGYILVWKSGYLFGNILKENLDIKKIVHIPKFDYSTKHGIIIFPQDINAGIDYHMDGVNIKRLRTDKNMIVIIYRDNKPKHMGIYDFNTKESYETDFNAPMTEFILKIGENIKKHITPNKSPDKNIF